MTEQSYHIPQQHLNQYLIKAVAGLQSTGGGVVPDSAVSDDTKRFEIDRAIHQEFMTDTM